MTSWIYVAGERNGSAIKIGKTTGETVRRRLVEVNKDQMTSDVYVLLAAVRGDPKDEKAMREPFRIQPKGSRREYLEPDAELVSYVNWLRAQWFVSVDQDEPAAGFTVVDSSHWLPQEGRTIAPPAIDDTQLVQDYDALPGPLAGTAWSWMTNPQASFQDYFTPLEIVDAARQAMGGIDLDPASHWLANKKLRIPVWYDRTRSAFENPWHGRVWLNPPYGENAQWFTEIEHWVTTEEVTQLCMLSPVWAFTTKIARPVMDLTSSMVLLSPTPKFWGNANPDKTGKNHPHAVIYIGERSRQFRDAFRSFGMPLEPHMDIEFIPNDPEPG